ncbi:MAG: restriction endonuclease subunit S, partial [Lachnospiraceae bacterium]|nr:restriction endonuclease subunit S [Lachnospiraceae bacterium]
MAKLLEITGKALSGEWGSNDETGNGIPVLRTTNFTNEGVVDFNNVVTRNITKKKIEEKYLRKGDIIIEKSGGSDKQPVGRVIYFDGPDNTYLFNNFTGLLRVKNQKAWYPRYVFYSLFSNYRKGGTRPFENKTTGLHNLKTDDYVSRYEVVETDMSTQIQICDQLDRMYGIIKMRQQELQKLDELIKARFVEMFGDININDKGWDFQPLGELCTIVRGGSPRPIERFLGGNVPWIKIGDATEGESIYLNSTKEHIIQEGIKKSRLVKAGSLIFANCGVSLGFARIITFDGCIHDGWLAMEDIDERLDKVFLLQALNQMTEHFRAIAPAGTQPNLNTAIMKAYKQILPPIEMQKVFIEFCKQVDKSKV